MAHWSVKWRVEGKVAVCELNRTEYTGGPIVERRELGRVPKGRGKTTEVDRRRFWSDALDALFGVVGEMGFAEAQRLSVKVARDVPIPPEPLWRQFRPLADSPLPPPLRPRVRDVTPPDEADPPPVRRRPVIGPSSGEAADAQQLGLLPPPAPARGLLENAIRSAVAAAEKERRK